MIGQAKRTGWQRWMLIAAAMAAVASGVAFFRPTEGSSRSTLQNSSDPVLRAVAALGRLEPASRVVRLAAANATEGQRVQELRVREGEWITAGTVVALLDVHAPRLASLVEAEARVGVSKAKLTLVKAGSRWGDIDAKKAVVSRLRHILDNADDEYRRSSRLHSTGAVARTEFEQKKMQRDAASMELRQAESLLKSTADVRDVDVALAEAELKQAEAAVGAAKAQVELARVLAPFAGRVLKIHTWPGEKVSDKGICELADTETMDAVAEVYESDVSRVKVGQSATIKVSALGSTLTGRVDQIGWMIGKKDVLNNDPVADTDARVVEVRIRLTSVDAARVAGLTNLRVEIVIGADGEKATGR